MSLTLAQIKKLRPEFKFGSVTMIDWFEVYHGKGYCCIRSGLRNADEEIKSPYYCDYFCGGKNSVKQCLIKFNEWWNLLNNILV
jgi:hypothetical protein